MMGIIPAAGSASRMQPLGSSKELLPLGRHPAQGGRPGAMRVVSEYLLERMLGAGAERICMIIAAEKTDLLRYYGRSLDAERLAFVVQPEPAGLCDAVFRAAPYVRGGEPVLIGLPDTLWFPADAFAQGLHRQPHLITFPVEHPEDFDAVVEDGKGKVRRVEVKRPGAAKRRVWGAITMPGKDFLHLHQLWLGRGRCDRYLGDLFNAWIESGGRLSCDHQGTRYWDIGTPAGYERALAERAWEAPQFSSDPPAGRQEARPAVALRVE